MLPAAASALRHPSVPLAEAVTHCGWDAFGGEREVERMSCDEMPWVERNRKWDTKKKDEMCAVEKKKEVGNKKKEKRKEKTKGGEKIGNKEKYII
jgi:hypothetical protein